MNSHLGNSFVPATDDLALADGEAEGLATGAGRVKDLSGRKRARVVHHCGLAGLREGDTCKE